MASNRFVAQQQHKPAAALHVNEDNCPLCSANHLLSWCKSFKKLAIDNRIERVKELHACFSCFRSGHGAKTCDRGGCHVYRAKHHILLHPGVTSELATNRAAGDTEARPVADSNTAQSLTSMTGARAAIVQITDGQGKIHENRALLDQGSQVNIIKEEFARRLGLK